MWQIYTFTLLSQAQAQPPQPQQQAPDSGITDLRKRIFTPDGKIKDQSKGTVNLKTTFLSSLLLFLSTKYVLLPLHYLDFHFSSQLKVPCFVFFWEFWFWLCIILSNFYFFVNYSLTILWAKSKTYKIMFPGFACLANKKFWFLCLFLVAFKFALCQFNLVSYFIMPFIFEKHLLASRCKPIKFPILCLQLQRRRQEVRTSGWEPSLFLVV